MFYIHPISQIESQKQFLKHNLIGCSRSLQYVLRVSVGRNVLASCCFFAPPLIRPQITSNTSDIVSSNVFKKNQQIDDLERLLKAFKGLQWALKGFFN